MRAREFITESRVVINEILMKDSGQDNDWKKKKYYEPFLEGIQEGMVYAFGIKEKKATKKAAGIAKQNFLGKILNSEDVTNQFSIALKTGNFKGVTFDVQVYNEDTNEPTEEIIKNLQSLGYYHTEIISSKLQETENHKWLASYTLKLGAPTKIKHVELAVIGNINNNVELLNNIKKISVQYLKATNELL